MSGNNNDFKVIETLTKSTEILLRRLIKFLVGKISLVRLQEMVRFIYVEEAENKLRLEKPKKNVALTKLALLTGLDTRTLTRIRNNESYRKPSHEKTSFVRESTPVVSMVDSWSSMEEFTDSVTGKPKVLRMTGKQGSFERLFAVTIKSRGITQQSILDRLIENGAVRLDKKSQTLELLKEKYYPISSEEQLDAFTVGFMTVANLMDSIVHNFETDSKEEKFFQRSVWTQRLPLHRRKALQAKLFQALATAEADVSKILIAAEDKSQAPDHIVSGVSFFYFEDDVPDDI